MLYRHDAPTLDRPVQRPARRVAMWTTVTVFLLLSCGFVTLAQHPAKADPRLVYPRIHAIGGVLPQGPQALMPSPAVEHRLLVNVDTDATTRGGVNQSLRAAAKILNLYALAGVPPEKVKVVLLFYGRGVRLALSNGAYDRHYHATKPNADLLAQLKQANVRMVACGQAMGHQQLERQDLDGGVELALSALTAREELQAEGYGTVPVELH